MSRLFVAWHRTVQDADFAIGNLADFELIAYRQHMVATGRRPATVNRRLDALRRLCRWARGTGALATDVARDVRPMRTACSHKPVALTDVEVHAVLREAGASSHGLAARNYAMVQLMLQARLRVGEVPALQASDITMNDRSGSVRIRHGKGLKAREVPLNATARRALRQHLDRTPAPTKDAPVFSSRETAMPTSIARRARLKASGDVGAHAASYLRAGLPARQVPPFWSPGWVPCPACVGPSRP